jgi:hypothetical protein
LSTTNWSFANFLPVHSPASPCISLQWTIRDGQTTNVPVPLLVKDDIILLRPGQRVPAKCVIMREVYYLKLFIVYLLSNFVENRERNICFIICWWVLNLLCTLENWTPPYLYFLFQNSVGEKTLMEGDIYIEEKETEKRRLSADVPQSKSPVSVSHFKLLETPYISQLR